MGIRTLSREIRYYPHLTALYMNNNKIVELPDDIFSELRSLVVVDVSFNLLSRIPSSIGNLDHLEKLAVHHNRITELPIEMGKDFLYISNLIMIKVNSSSLEKSISMAIR
jgi:Leucine-rich repeat (LRR) protein